MNIAIVGAFDRYNYGDILMPIILKKEIEKNINNKEINIDYYGLSKSNMEFCGGIDTEELSKIYNKKYEIVILDGGDILSVNWSDMFLNLQTSKIRILLFKIIRKISYNFSNEIARKKLKGRTEKPWVLDKEELKCNKLIYNTVDGKIENNIKSKTINTIKKIDYISLRNEEIFKDVKKTNSNAKLYPDSVISLSKYFTEEEIEKKVSKKVKDFVQNNKYYVFQCKNTIGKKYYEDIIENINKISLDLKIKCLLLPIGYAQGHEDQIILKKINNELEEGISDFFEFNNIYEIIYMIKNSKLFIGTSLHGLITSISYGIPHIAYTKEIVKQIKFLNTWKTTPMIYTNPKKMYENTKNILNNYEENISKLQERKSLLENLAEENFENINNIIKMEIKKDE